MDSGNNSISDFLDLSSSFNQDAYQEEMKLSSDFAYYTGDSSSIKTGPGRTKNRITLVLENFRVEKSKKVPKKEYFNAFIIRSIKRAFRCVITGRIPSKTNIRVDLQNPIQSASWKKILTIYTQNPQPIIELSKTETGPETDGRTHRGKAGSGQRNSGNVQKSFNNQFCKRFFSEIHTQQAFKAIVEIMYSENDFDKFIKRFGFRCCAAHDHIPECGQKWEQLKNYLEDYYFEDLEIIPARDSENLEEDDRMNLEFNHIDEQI